MKETLLRLPTSDGFSLYSTIRQQGSKKIVIHLHGMTHTMTHLLEVMSADFFTSKGYDHCRVGLYARESGSRSLSQSSLSTHVMDIRTIIDHFSVEYDEIYVSAHSLSGLCMMILNSPLVTAMSLWDPALDVPNFWKNAGCLKYIEEAACYHLDYGNVFVISQEMVQEIADYSTTKCQDLARHIKTPTQFIIPNESIFLGSDQLPAKDYQTLFQGAFDYQHINHANHTFSKMHNQQILFEKTLAWFDRY